MSELAILTYLIIVAALAIFFNHARYRALAEDVTRALVKFYSGFNLSEEEEEAVTLLHARRPRMFYQAEVCALLIINNRRKGREE